MEDIKVIIEILGWGFACVTAVNVIVLAVSAFVETRRESKETVSEEA